ncbi:putative outer membrane starch-binding protein [Dysgonomonas alginatilytica]|uniref:Putative outer membrane starch-binding protein n=1 Tax=Dysgonomonas alginatilytica TaxID=1605892 RepID=A0A2V3PST5_9BACT|nr:RagB/SusD family nutrient uptake outer membrane protein [Dysgonomonas alginatilytica]PXV68760.1 putative outer membrane starch-binding protein [Dysgonomonas alginatilytica]
MNLKNKIVIIASLLIGIFFVSCNDEFMERYPESEISPKNFFKNPQDLNTYLNGLYGDIITSSYGDQVSDNENSNEDESMYKMMRGDVKPQTEGTWNWEKLRKINFLIENHVTAVGDQTEINHYVGIARLFRAYHYYGKVRTFSDVPWYSKTLQTGDTEELYKTQDSRAVVVDKILEDLAFAVENIQSVGNFSSKTRVTKWAALALQARIALEEGTYRKYHAELELTDHKRFLELARDAAKKIFIENNQFSLYKAKGTLEPYQALFVSLDLSTNPEIIWYEQYKQDLNSFHNVQVMYNNYYGLTRDLMEDYLVINGNTTKTFQQVPGYDKMSVNDIFTNRDPRLGYTFMKPGHIRAGVTIPTKAKFGIGGYVQVKYDPLTYDQISWNKSYTALPLIRLAEVLLVYAEARAELGELTQSDLDITINLLRDRVGMPHMILSNVLSAIDPVQANRYPNVSGTQRGAILEVRRERRIELACEGFRANDIYRWKVGTLMAKESEGIYISGLGYHDITGDGLPDIAVVKTQADADKIPEDDKQKYKLTIYILDGNTFYLSEGDHGYVKITAHKNRFTFQEPKYYYKPISDQDILINSNLVQNKYWK